MSNPMANASNPYASPIDVPTVRSQRLFPGRGMLITLGILELLAVVILIGVQPLDRAIANVGFVLFNVIAAICLMTWFVFRSTYSPLVRLLAPPSVVGLCIAIVYLFPPQSMSGTLVPTLRWRWSSPPDALLKRPDPPASGGPLIDLTIATDDDFPQFLGPNRDAALRDIDLAREWDAKAPQLVWRQKIGAGWAAFSAVNGYAVTLEQRGAEELVTCYEIATGRLVWSHAERTRHESFLGGLGPRSTPTIHAGKVYTLGATGRLLCLNGGDGSLVWRKDLWEEFGTDQSRDEQAVAWGRANSPLVVDDLVVVPAGGPKDGRKVSLVAYDRETGERRWEAGNTQISYVSPSIVRLGDVPMILSINESNLTAHEIETGNALWSHPWPGNSAADASNSQPHVLEGDRILLTKGYGVGAAMLKVSKTKDGDWEIAEVWANRRALKTKFTNVAVVDECAYGLSDGILECVDLENGRSLWKKGRYEHGQLLAVDDLLLLMAEDGGLYLVEATPRAHRELGHISALNGRTWNNVCLYGKLLLIRNGEEAACYELP